MSSPALCLLKNRGYIRVSGEDSAKYLQGLISNDIEKATPDKAIHAAFLTAQGKYLHDFFVLRFEDGYLLECEGDRASDLFRRLRMYKLRSKVELTDVSEEFTSYVIFGDAVATAMGLKNTVGAMKTIDGGFAFIDSRLTELGARLILRAGETPENLGLADGNYEDYENLRISLGIPDGSRDLEVDKALLLESGYDELGTVDWDKGCYMGQELTARTRYRGLVKKRILPVEISGDLPPSGAKITADGKEAGELRTTGQNQGLALLRLAQIDEDTPLKCGDAILKPAIPSWVKFQDAK